MKISKRSFIVCMVMVAVLSISLTYGSIQLTVWLQHDRPSRPYANVEYVFETWDGVFCYAEHNVVTNIAENFTRDAFSRGIGMNATKLAVGNVTDAAQTNTTLASVYDDPTDGNFTEGAIVEWLSGGDAAYNCTWQWTFEETTNLNAAALYIGNTTFCYAIANFPGGAQTFSSGENLTVRWTPVFDAND